MSLEDRRAGSCDWHIEIVQHAQSQQQELFMVITITCPSEFCSRQPMTLWIPAHHAKMLRNICIETIDQYPEFTESTEVLLTPPSSTSKH